MKGKLMYFIFGILFLTTVILSDILPENYVNFLDTRIYLSLYTIPISYFFISIIAELYSLKNLHWVIWIGCIYKVATSLLIIINVLSSENTPFTEVINDTLRKGISSVIAYLLGYFAFSFIFYKIKIITSEKYFWLRTICAILISSGIDSVIYINGAYLLVLPSNILGKMFYVQYVFKFFLGILFIPLLYAITSMIKKKDNNLIIINPDFQE